MTTFFIGSFTTTGFRQLRGLSFTPNVAGPSGSGSPGQATSVQLTRIIAGVPFSGDVSTGPTCYLYSAPLTDPDDIGTSTGLISSASAADAGSTFGSGTYATKYDFTSTQLDPTATYYAYFSANKSVSVDYDATYTGGSIYDVDLLELSDAARFKIEMSY